MEAGGGNQKANYEESPSPHASARLAARLRPAPCAPGGLPAAIAGPTPSYDVSRKAAPRRDVAPKAPAQTLKIGGGGPTLPFSGCSASR